MSDLLDDILKGLAPPIVRQIVDRDPCPMCGVNPEKEKCRHMKERRRHAHDPW